MSHHHKHNRLGDGIGRGFLLSLLTAMSALSLLEGQAMGVSPRTVVNVWIEQLKSPSLEAFFPFYEEGGLKRLWNKGWLQGEAIREEEPTLPPIEDDHVQPSTATEGNAVCQWLPTLMTGRSGRWLPFAPQLIGKWACVGCPYSLGQSVAMARCETPLPIVVERIAPTVSRSLCIRGPNVCLPAAWC